MQREEEKDKIKVSCPATPSLPLHHHKISELLRSPITPPHQLRCPSGQ